jgi:hypothetical protein
MSHATFTTAPIHDKALAEKTLHALNDIVITATLFECEAEGIWFVTGVLRCTMTEPLRLLNMQKSIYTTIAWIKDANSFGIKE